MAEAICKLSKQYNCGDLLLAECENANCLKRIKELDPSIPCFLTTMGDYERGTSRALKAKFDGLSFKYDGENISKEQIKDLHAKGLQIQLWTINASAEIKKAAGLLPDYIQTDNVLMK